MEAGASIIAFIGFGLTSIKNFYQFVSSIKDGPEKVRDLSIALASLQAAYERTQSLQDLPDVFSSSPSLVNLLKRCNEDVSRFEKKIGKLTVQPQDRFHGVLWKRLKMALGEDDVAHILDVVSRYVGDFNLEISLINLRLSHRSSNGISKMVVGGEKQLFVMEQQHTTLTKISEDMSHSVFKIQQVHDVVDALALRALAVPSLSVEQSVGIVERLARLEGQVRRLQSERPEKDEDVLGAMKVLKDEDDDVELSIKRLCALVDRQDHHVESDEAQDILDDLETLLQELSVSSRPVRPSKRPEISGGDEKGVFRDLKQFRGVLNSGTELSLNQRDTEQRSSMMLAGNPRNQLQKTAKRVSPHGTWTISTRKRWRVCITEKGERVLEEKDASVLFKPRKQGPRYIIKASIRQVQQLYGFQSLTPTISVSRIRPLDSKVFECIKSGSLDGLRQLLSSGEASLQDRDEKGASLLHHAFDQPDILRFLIAHGADVDETASCDHIGHDKYWTTRMRKKYTPPLFLCATSSKPEAFKLLLEAGADLTSDFNFVYNDLPRKEFRYRIWGFLLYLPTLPESLLSTLLHSAGNSCASLRVINGTMLHDCCMNSQVDLMRTLISNGARVDARDASGQTPLQYLMSHIRLAGWSLEADKDSAILLIGNGANIWARDNNDKSIWDTARDNQQQGSYARDMWDYLLAYFGHHSEVQDSARDNPRHAVYCKGWYSRVEFETIWRGMEHLCPYYDDEELGLDTASIKSLTHFGSPAMSVASSGSTETAYWGEIEDEGEEKPESRNRKAAKSVGLSVHTLEEHDDTSGSDKGRGEPEAAPDGFEVYKEHESQLEQPSPQVSVEAWLSNSLPEYDSPETTPWEHPTHVGISSQSGMDDEVFQNPWAD